jgi:hypothetical protein
MFIVSMRFLYGFEELIYVPSKASAFYTDCKMLRSAKSGEIISAAQRPNNQIMRCLKYLRGTENLRGTGNPRVTENSRVTENLRGTENSRVTENLRGTGNLRGTENLRVTENLRGTGNLRVTENLRGTGNPRVTENLRGTGNPRVTALIEVFLFLDKSSKLSLFNVSKGYQSLNSEQRSAELHNAFGCQFIFLHSISSIPHIIGTIARNAVTIATPIVLYGTTRVKIPSHANSRIAICTVYRASVLAIIWRFFARIRRFASLWHVIRIIDFISFPSYLFIHAAMIHAKLLPTANAAVIVHAIIHLIVSILACAITSLASGLSFVFSSIFIYLSCRVFLSRSDLPIHTAMQVYQQPRP